MTSSMPGIPISTRRTSPRASLGIAAAGSDPYANLTIRSVAACAETCRKHAWKQLRYPPARPTPVIGETPVFVLRNVR